ncbi:MAG TPA: cytochrome c oxidase subunit 3 family protein [Lacipirellulaceae bacterium]|jgi:cytochrome c oxidase subunit 3|nr:cytochrome c oxidase subunit 3 family protein [Lacipirellulaceae bacterium]
MATDHAAPHWHHFDDLEHQQQTTLFGMWLFLATEVLIFGAIFTAYTIYRHQYSEAFEAASRHLNLWIGGINTLVLLTSSLTMALGVHAAQQGRSRACARQLVVTAILGTTFLALKALEYYLDYRENLVPIFAFDPEQWSALNVRPQHVELFLIFYYFLTGLHAIHLLIGIVVVLVIAWYAHRERFSAEYHSPVEAWGLYWHFVDVVWVFLLPLLYLIGTRTY